MKREAIKTAVLVLLVTSSLLLTGQIWFDKKLWPEGYNFFVNVQTVLAETVDSIFGGDGGDVVVADSQRLSPKHFVAYTVKEFDHAGLILTPDYAYYKDAEEYVVSALTGALGAQPSKLVKQTEDDWQNALFTRGLYIEYPAMYSTETFSVMMGAQPDSLADTIASVQRFVVVPGDSFTNDIWVYIRDESDGGIYRVSPGVDKPALERLLLNISEDASAQNRFSFFIGADRPTGAAGEVVFAPYLLLCEEGQKRRTILSENPIGGDGAVDISAYNMERLLRAFSINPLTVVKYIDAYGNIVFVQNNDTLKISTDGVIEYYTLQNAKGPVLEDVPSASLPASGVVSIANAFAERILGIAGNSDRVRLYYSGISGGPNNYTVYFDYTYNGTPIVFAQDHFAARGDGEAAPESGNPPGSRAVSRSAVTVELEGNRLKSYTHIVRMYESTGQTYTTLSSYQAVDRVFADVSGQQSQSRVDDMNICYDDDGTEGVKQPYWFIRINGYDKYVR